MADLRLPLYDNDLEDADGIPAEVQALADQIVAALDAAGANLHRHPRLEAGFSVLKAADIPSVLIELGFISDAEDLANLMDAEWRERAQQAIRDALVAWVAEDQARAALLRQ